ncbi:MAG: hypothetical protein NT089_01155 [Planctomycetia bacterium]|nr:hypothetical protein [Planctomycetia bacterium]
MESELHILLVSPDLLSTSRIAGLAKDMSAQVETLRSLDDTPRGGPFDLVLIDTGSVLGDPAVSVARVRAIVDGQQTQVGRVPKLIAFGPHVAKQRLDNAKAAGADDTVSRGELLGAFPTLVKRWCSR